MPTADSLFVLGLKGSVSALRRQDGRLLWTTDLPGIWGNHFVTVACDDEHVYAHTRGQVHCLDINSGRILWSNRLAGYGYGIATLGVPGGVADPRPAAQAHAEAKRRSHSPHPPTH